ncbi:hypothetical protein [Anaerocellum danielii]|uniref:hypothetical protein n=1 Tax=Anaerocellum danielii TaxID=1387557 RepID=UPI000B05D02D|nr:hypothetical protein [Caldicellulosiruptor danielii]
MRKLRGIVIFVLIFSLISVILLIVNLLPLKSYKSSKEYADVVPFNEIDNLSKREQVLLDMLQCSNKNFFKIYLNNLKSQYLAIWTEEYVNGKKTGGIQMGTIIEKANDVEVGILYSKEGRYFIYAIDKNGWTTSGPVPLSILSEKGEKSTIINPSARVKNDQPFVLSFWAEGEKDKNNNGIEITENTLYLKYDSKYFQQIAKRYKHVFIVAAKLTNKLQ